MPKLSSKQLDEFRQRLVSAREDLRTQYENEKAAADTVQLDQTKVGRLSRMDAMQLQSMAQSTMRNIETRLKRIGEALNKLDEDDFGYCDECGNEIAFERLEVQPEAPCCFACQSRQER